jgi:hypothetical protein
MHHTSFVVVHNQSVQTLLRSFRLPAPLRVAGCLAMTCVGDLLNYRSRLWEFQHIESGLQGWIAHEG